MKTLSLCFCLAACLHPSGAQTELSSRRETRAPVFVDALSYATAETPRKARLEVYVQVPYEEIRFLKVDDTYVGTFDITVTIVTVENEPVWNRVHTVEVRTRDFAQTVSNKFSSLRQISFDMVPGEYDMRVEILDQDSKKAATVRKKVNVPDYAAHTLSMSDAMLVTRVTTSGERRSIVPNVAGFVTDEAEGFFVFSEVYAPASVSNASMTATILNGSKDSVLGAAQTEMLDHQPHQSFIKFGTADLPMGKYTLHIQAVAVDSTGAPLIAETTRDLFIRWSDLPSSITDLNKAVDQMRYVAKDGEIEFIRESASEEEKRVRFLEFWKKRDPDPQTDRNELMEEYYHRVDYSNRSFGHYVEGWRTDRGMVYVRFGSPDNVERHPFETNVRPYEVWRYYNLNYEFVFVDETGFGDYRLRYPTTDLLGRIRPDQ